MFFGLTMWNCFLLLGGKLKIKHLSLFITRGGGRKNEGGDYMVFRGTEGRKQSLLKEYKGGGRGATEQRTLTANEGDH